MITAKLIVSNPHHAIEISGQARDWDDLRILLPELANQAKHSWYVRVYGKEEYEKRLMEGSL